MPPKRARIADTAAAASKQLHEAAPPVRLMGPPKGLSTPWKLTLLPVVALSTSALLYTLADPFIDRQLPSVSSEPQLWHKVAPLAGKVVTLWLAWALKLDATNAFALTLQTRMPFYFLLFLFYNVSLQTVVTSALIDATSSSVAFILIGRSRPFNYTRKAAARSVEARALYDVFNSVLLTLLAAAIYALSLYTLSLTLLPRWMVTNFYPLPSLERAYDANLVHFAVLCLPLGWATREFLFGPATSVDSETGTSRVVWFPMALSRQTVTLALRIRTLYALTWLETLLRTYTSLEGSSVFGAGLWAALWAGMIWFVGVVLAYVGAAAHVKETAEPALVVREDEVAPPPTPAPTPAKKTHRRKASKATS